MGRSPQEAGGVPCKEVAVCKTPNAERERWWPRQETGNDTRTSRGLEGTARLLKVSTRSTCAYNTRFQAPRTLVHQNRHQCQQVPLEERKLKSKPCHQEKPSPAEGIKEILHCWVWAFLPSITMHHATMVVNHPLASLTTYG